MSIFERVQLGFCNKWLYETFCVNDKLVQRYKRWHGYDHSDAVLDSALEAAFLGDLQQVQRSISRYTYKHVKLGGENAKALVKSAAYGGHKKIVDFFHSRYDYLTHNNNKPFFGDINQSLLFDMRQLLGTNNRPIRHKSNTRKHKRKLQDKPAYDTKDADIVYLWACLLGFYPLVKYIIENIDVNIGVLRQGHYTTKYTNRKLYDYLSNKIDNESWSTKKRRIEN